MSSCLMNPPTKQTTMKGVVVLAADAGTEGLRPTGGTGPPCAGAARQSAKTAASERTKTQIEIWIRRNEIECFMGQRVSLCSLITVPLSHSVAGMVVANYVFAGVAVLQRELMGIAVRGRPQHSHSVRPTAIPTGLGPDANIGEGMKEPEYVQEPQNHADHHDGIQDRLDRSLHRDEIIDQPKQNTHYDQNHQQLDYGHRLIPPHFLGRNRPDPRSCAYFRAIRKLFSPAGVQWDPLFPVMFRLKSVGRSAPRLFCFPHAQTS